MLTAYDIQPGHNWRKRDVVKALYEFSEQWVVVDEQKHVEDDQNANQENDIDECMYCTFVILALITI